MRNVFLLLKVTQMKTNIWVAMTKLSFFIQLKFYDQKFNRTNDLYFEFYGACFIARSIWLV